MSLVLFNIRDAFELMLYRNKQIPFAHRIKPKDYENYVDKN
jgi:hypothetical protein